MIYKPCEWVFNWDLKEGLTGPAVPPLTSTEVPEVLLYGLINGIIKVIKPGTKQLIEASFCHFTFFPPRVRVIKSSCRQRYKSLAEVSSQKHNPSTHHQNSQTHTKVSSSWLLLIGTMHKYSHHIASQLMSINDGRIFRRFLLTNWTKSSSKIFYVFFFILYFNNWESTVKTSSSTLNTLRRHPPVADVLPGPGWSPSEVFALFGILLLRRLLLFLLISLLGHQTTFF